MLIFLLSAHSEYGIKRPIDDQIILKISQGDMEALQQLYENVSGALFGFTLSIVKNSHDAEDILQEIFLKVYEKSGDYIPQGKPMAWLFTIARNLSLDKLRSNSKNTNFNESSPYEIDLSLVESAENKILIEMLFKLLDYNEKQIIILHCVGGIKHREIAKILDLPVNTVLSKYHRALKKIRRNNCE